jgi:hypothetical protein
MVLQNLAVAPNNKHVADQHDPNTPHFALSPVHNPEMDDDDIAVATLEERQKRIELELKKRKLAASRTRKEEEERRLIAAGEGELANSNIQPTRCLHDLTF